MRNRFWHRGLAAPSRPYPLAIFSKISPFWRASQTFIAINTVAICLIFPVHAQSHLPTLGESGDLTTSAERRLGDRIIRELYRDPDYIDDPVIADYVQGIWQPLMEAARARGELSAELDERFAWEILLGRDRTVNAFALPGGYLGVHLGLVGVVATRDELASVLAHELSHVTQRHISRLITQQSKQTPLLLGALVLGALAASKNPGATQALVVGGQALAMQNQLNFSRDMEREADRIGYGLMAPAGFSPLGFVSMFDKLQQANRLNDNGSWPYLRSHPLTSERIAEARGRLGTAGGRKATPSAAQWLHAVMQGRARALMDGRTQTLTRLAGGGVPTAAAAAQTPEALSTACAAAMAATRLKDWRVADAALARAKALAAPQGEAVQRPVLVMQVESLLERGQTAEAARVLSGGVLDGSRAGLLLAARLATLAGAEATLVARTREDLQTWVALHPGDGSAWLALAQVQERQGAPLAALRAHAEARHAEGDLSGAVDRLRAGQRLARSQGAVESVEGVIIESRLKAIEQQRRIEMEQERNGQRE